MKQTIKKWTLLTAMIATLYGGVVKGMELSDAIRTGDIEAGTIAIQNGADVGAMWRGLHNEAHNIHNLETYRMMVRTALFCGMKPNGESMIVPLLTGDPKIVKLAMDSCDYDVNSPMDTFSRGTMLHWASILKKFEVVIFLVNRGADSTLKNKDQQTPLDVDTSPEISNYLKNSYKKDAWLCFKLAKTVLKNQEFWLDACFSYFTGGPYEQRNVFEIAIDDYVNSKNLTEDKKHVAKQSKSVWIQRKKLFNDVIPDIYNLAKNVIYTQSIAGLTKKRPLFTDLKVKIVASGKKWSPKEIGL